MELNFKTWLEDIDPAQAKQPDPNALKNDPTIGPAQKKAQMAVQDAIKKGKNPIQAAQQAVATSNVPMNRLGDIMPKDQTIKRV
jgi:hypothetical protein